MTREEAIKRLKEARSTIQPFRYVDEAIDYAVKAIEQESILDKIRAEITDWQTDIHDNEYDAESHDFVFERIYEIIDKYKAESEE